MKNSSLYKQKILVVLALITICLVNADITPDVTYKYTADTSCQLTDDRNDQSTSKTAKLFTALGTKLQVFDESDSTFSQSITILQGQATTPNFYSLVLVNYLQQVFMASADAGLKNFNLHLGKVDTSKFTYTELNTISIAYQITSLILLNIQSKQILAVMGANANINFYEISFNSKKNTYTITASTTISSMNNNDNILSAVLATTAQVANQQYLIVGGTKSVVAYTLPNTGKTLTKYNTMPNPTALNEMIYFTSSEYMVGSDGQNLIKWQWQVTPSTPVPSVTVNTCGTTTDICQYLTKIEASNLFVIAQPTQFKIFIYDHSKDTASNLVRTIAYQNGKSIRSILNRGTNLIIADDSQIIEIKLCDTAQYWDVTNAICRPCSDGCQICTSDTVCTQCAQTYFQKEQGCVNACPSNYYTSGNQCLLCLDPCTSCDVSATSCTSCKAAQNLFQNTCVDNCPDQFFADTNVCKNCLSQCLTCGDANSCKTCDPKTDSKYFYNNNCYSKCPDTTYPDDPSLTCMTCIDSCKTCTTSTDCQACIDTFYSNNGACTNKCPDKTFGNDKTQTCDTCDSTCVNCIQTSTTCLSCPDQKVLSQQACLDNCLDGYYADTSSVCQTCDPKCLKCTTTATTCTDCLPSKYLYNSDCVDACPDKTFGIVQDLVEVCAPCDNSCQTCDNSNTCLTCPPGAFLYKSLCQATCTAGTMKDPTNTQCLDCESTCATCSAAVDQCDTCKPEFKQDGTKCVSQCPDQKFYDTNQNSCQSCVNPCYNCQTTADNCISCQPEQYLNGATCVTQCPANTIINQFTCVTCDVSCKVCSGTITNCGSCSDGYFQKSDNTCTQNCPFGTFKNTIQKTCQDCKAPCASCDQLPDTCLSCQNGNFLKGNTCSTSCGNTAVPNTQTQVCDDCQSPCMTCQVTVQQCLSCINGKFLNGNLCVDASSCPDSTYADASSNKCNSCTSPCKNCKNTATNCLNCIDNYYYYSNACINSCSTTQYADQTIMQCFDCSNSCYTCSQSTTNCLSCNQGKFLFKNSCVSQCSNGYFPDTSTQFSKCSQCMTNCIICTAGNQCNQCLDRYFFDQSQLKCSPCDIICATCDQSSTHCLTCRDGYKLLNYQCFKNCDTNTYSYNGICLQSCPDTYFGDNVNKVCRSCNTPCGNCQDNSDTCSSCYSMYDYLYQSKCISYYPSGAYCQNHQCFGCDSSCAECQGPAKTDCTSCPNGKTLNIQNNQCENTTNDDDNDNGLPGWGIALIVIGCVLVVAVGGFFGMKYWRKSRSQKLLTTNEYQGSKYTNLKGDSSL